MHAWRVGILQLYWAKLRRRAKRCLRAQSVRARRYISLGARGERAARRYLKGLGFHIRHMNWKCAIGEFDIVAQDGSTLVFVEVKTRRHSVAATFTPEMAVNLRKQQRLRKLASWYEQDFEADLRYRRLRHKRFDVIAVTELPWKLFPRCRLRYLRDYFAGSVHSTL